MAHKVASSKIWCPAIYARLSKEDMDTGKKSVSLSIEHQINLLEDYVKSQGWQVPKVFYDDDRTGTNFNRKGFQDMYAAAKRGEINVIVIKDTSRFGRNWVQSGVYFESIEEMGIRFISIQENLDTADPQCPALKMLPFYFIFNEWHSQTTSEKIKAVFQKQAEQGKYLAPTAPYGFNKDSDNKYRLIIDPYAAGIVKRIFDMRLQKVSYRAIARKLNADGIISCSGYYAQNRGIENKHTRISQWSSQTVKMVLENPVYCGDVVNGKKSSASYKNQKVVRKPFEEWVIVKNMHEAIVSREDWEKCQAMREGNRIRSTTANYVAQFSGLLRCLDCGYHLSRTNSQYKLNSGEKKFVYGFNCGTRLKKGLTACASHYITENCLHKLVIADIRDKAGEILQDENAVRERFYAIKAKSSGAQLNHDRRALKKVNKRLEDLDNLIQAAFEKSVLGCGSPDMFTTLSKKYEAEKHGLAKQAQELTSSIENQSQTENDVDTFIALMKKHSDITELDRATVVELIDHITVSASSITPREIVIYYNLMGNV
jgi:DNA invertase Pin-like site-specific DNA recombinase